MPLQIIIDAMQSQRPDITPQLDLDELILGLGALPVTNLATRVLAMPEDVQRLTSLSELQTLQLMNGDVGPHLGPGISASILKLVPATSYSCTSLKRMTVDVMGDEIVDLITHLRSLSSSLTGLEVGRDKFSDQDHLYFGSSLIGCHWSKLHLGTVPLATAEFFKMGNKDRFSVLEELSLYFGRDAHKKMGRVEPEEYGQWVSVLKSCHQPEKSSLTKRESLLLSELAKLPNLRRLRINWDQRLSTETTQRIAKGLFVGHREAIHPQDQPSGLVYISSCDNHTYSCNHSYARLTLPASNVSSVARVEDWEVVKLPDDEPLD